jgi:hypothetical protein
MGQELLLNTLTHIAISIWSDAWRIVYEDIRCLRV